MRLSKEDRERLKQFAEQGAIKGIGAAKDILLLLQDFDALEAELAAIPERCPECGIFWLKEAK